MKSSIIKLETIRVKVNNRAYVMAIWVGEFKSTLWENILGENPAKIEPRRRTKCRGLPT